MSKGQIDHSFFETKVRLRIDNLPDKNKIAVLDCYAGQGLIWAAIRKRTGKDISVLSIERKNMKGKIYLHGDNTKFNIDYDLFDCIDLDAYGVPYVQMKNMFASVRRETIIFVTFITQQWGNLPRGMLNDLGYTTAMVKKIPTLFNRRPQEKLFAWLANHDVKRIKIYETNNGNKNYLCCKINKNK